MQLVVDASTLVAEGLRGRGRDLLAHPDLELFITVEVWSEAQHELGRRISLMVQQARLTEDAADYLLRTALTAVETGVAVVPAALYADALPEAYRRVPRDPRDAPSVALALTLRCGILTGDYDFFGCGVPVWTVETLLLHLEAGGAS